MKLLPQSPKYSDYRQGKTRLAFTLPSGPPFPVSKYRAPWNPESVSPRPSRSSQGLDSTLGQELGFNPTHFTTNWNGKPCQDLSQGVSLCLSVLHDQFIGENNHLCVTYGDTEAQRESSTVSPIWSKQQACHSACVPSGFQEWALQGSPLEPRTCGLEPQHCCFFSCVTSAS